MKFIDAASHGKPFRKIYKNGEKSEYYIDQIYSTEYGECFMAIFEDGEKEVLQLVRSDLLFGEYELVPEKTYEITESQLNKIFDKLGAINSKGELIYKEDLFIELGIK